MTGHLVCSGLLVEVSSGVVHVSRDDSFGGRACEKGPPWPAYRAPDGAWRPPHPEGLARVLAKAGYGARSRANGLVQAGRVTVDGHVIRDGGHAVTAENEIRLDGEILREAVRRFIALNKPSGVDCQCRGNHERHVGHYLPAKMVGLEPAWRLAPHARGLVLMSNDLWWNARICHNSKLPRGYEVLVRGAMSAIELGVIGAGMNLPGQGHFKADEVSLIAEEDGNALIGLRVTGGHDRHIRSAFKAMRRDVLRVTRVSLGPVVLGTMPCGRFRPLTEEEIASLIRG